MLTPMVGRPNAPRPARAWSMRAGDLVLLGGAINLAYAAVIVHALAHPASPWTSWIDTWMRIARLGLEPAYVLAGGPDCGGVRRAAFIDRAWIFDVHLTTINLLVVATLFAISHPFWTAWAQRLHEAPQEDGPADNSQAADAEEGFGTVLWGAIAAAWWMTLQNDLFDSAARCADLRPWFLLREPLLATAAHGLACLAAALEKVHRT